MDFATLTNPTKMKEQSGCDHRIQLLPRTDYVMLVDCQHKFPSSVKRPSIALDGTIRYVQSLSLLTKLLTEEITMFCKS